MKNREWLNNMALIDLLYLANNEKHPFSMNACIIDRLEKCDGESECRSTDCYECICKWLNEEVKSHEK